MRRSAQTDDVAAAAGEQRRRHVLALDAREGAMAQIDLDLRPVSSPSARAPTAEPISKQRLGREDPAAAALPPAMPSSSRSSSNGSIRTFESVPMQSGMPRWAIRTAGRNPSPRSASVVGQRADRGSVGGEQVELGAVGVGRVDDGGPLGRGSPFGRAARSAGSRARRGIPRSRAAARPRGRAAGALRVGVAAEIASSQSRGHAGRSAGRRRPDASARSASTSPRYAADGLLPHARKAAARVRDVEEDEGDARLRGCLRRGARLGDAEVVELADGGVARSGAAPVDRRVLRAHELRRLALRPRRASRRARPRSRRPRPGRAAPAGTRGCARSRSPAGSRVVGRGHDGRR